jgi:glycosyltransferase involved in cell wall biosynthesis
MRSRLGSIFHQTYPVQEILVLDDCSRDDSLTIIPEVAAEAGRAIRLIVNETNSGSVFVQWRRAAESARGDFVWIAEADDLSDPDFLERAAALLVADPSVVLAFTDSRTVDANGNPQWDSYKGYYATIEPGALTETAIFCGAEFVRRFLSVKNLILNVSAVVWRRTALLRALNACADSLLTYKMAGNWLLYLTALATPGAHIGYEARALNVHRRHATSVTHALDADRHIDEIARCHAIAATAFELPNAAIVKQTSYIAEVTQQLHASQAAAPTATPQADPPAKPARRRRPKVAV